MIHRTTVPNGCLFEVGLPDLQSMEVRTVQDGTCRYGTTAKLSGSTDLSNTLPSSKDNSHFPTILIFTNSTTTIFSNPTTLHGTLHHQLPHARSITPFIFIQGHHRGRDIPNQEDVVISAHLLCDLSVVHPRCYIQCSGSIHNRPRHSGM